MRDCAAASTEQKAANFAASHTVAVLNARDMLPAVAASGAENNILHHAGCSEMSLQTTFRRE